ncbi:MAG: archaeosortase/exosortase family protein [Bacteroidia bacterium]|nr:archaeosortase/exosortase family protein [Bacteroidia bacterium]
MFPNLLKNKFFVFLLKAGTLYLIWYLLYELYITPRTRLNLLTIDVLISHSTTFLEWMGYPLIERPYDEIYRTMGIDGSNGVWIGDSCNGLTLFAIFTIFILSWPGPWKRKLWFIPAGIAIIHTLNVVRIAVLSLIAFHHTEWLDFNHTYTFQALVYGVIFLLWMWWANKISKPTLPDESPKN